MRLFATILGAGVIVSLIVIGLRDVLGWARPRPPVDTATPDAPIPPQS